MQRRTIGWQIHGRGVRVNDEQCARVCRPIDISLQMRETYKKRDPHEEGAETGRHIISTIRLNYQFARERLIMTMSPSPPLDGHSTPYTAERLTESIFRIRRDEAKGD